MKIRAKITVKLKCLTLSEHYHFTYFAIRNEVHQCMRVSIFIAQQCIRPRQLCHHTLSPVAQTPCYGKETSKEI